MPPRDYARERNKSPAWVGVEHPTVWFTNRMLRNPAVKRKLGHTGQLRTGISAPGAKRAGFAGLEEPTADIFE